MPRIAYALDDKYTIVSRILNQQQGSLLDIGARDRILMNKLSRGIQYFSTDLYAGHDYQIDLEKKIPLPDQKFDFVVALDVLEHVENIHAAFGELARITRRKLIVALPNIGVFAKRWSYLWKGRLRTGKYDLLPMHQGDRHRWFTIYPEINRFIMQNEAGIGFSLETIYEEIDKYPVFGRLALYAARLGLLRGGLMTDRCIYVLSRNKS